MAKERPKAKNSRRNALLAAIDVVLLLMLFVAAFFLIRALNGYRKDRSTYQQAAETAVSTPAPTETETTAATPTPYYLSDGWQPPQETPPIEVDFAAVRENGRHTQAWLYSEGTVINYPVVAYSNNEYYLTHDYTGARSQSGALFFDERNTKELAGQNWIIYGHHMKDKSMFGSLLNYQKQDYFDAHSTLYLLTPAQNYRVTVFAAWYCDGAEKHYPVWFDSDAARRQFVDRAVAATEVDTRMEYDGDAPILSLVTCSYSNYLDDAHFQVNGWLTPIGNVGD